jgi:hypothetical protein
VLYNNLLKTTFWKKVGPKLQPMEKKVQAKQVQAKQVQAKQTEPKKNNKVVKRRKCEK